VYFGINEQVFRGNVLCYYSEKMETETCHETHFVSILKIQDAGSSERFYHSTKK
jgi:hypothetical protein